MDKVPPKQLSARRAAKALYGMNEEAGRFSVIELLCRKNPQSAAPNRCGHDREGSRCVGGEAVRVRPACDLKGRCARRYLRAQA